MKSHSHSSVLGWNRWSCPIKCGRTVTSYSHIFALGVAFTDMSHCVFEGGWVINFGTQQLLRERVQEVLLREQSCKVNNFEQFVLGRLRLCRPTFREKLLQLSNFPSFPLFQNQLGSSMQFNITQLLNYHRKAMYFSDILQMTRGV